MTSEVINIYHGEETLIPITSSSLTLDAMEEAVLKVYVDAEGDDVGKCTIYIMDETKNSITDAEGRKMRFEEKDCTNTVFTFPFKPPARYIGKTLEMDVVVYLAGHEGEPGSENWYDSSKTYITITENRFEPPFSLSFSDCEEASAEEIEIFNNLQKI